MPGGLLYIITFIIVASSLIFALYKILSVREINNYKDQISTLDREKNMIASLPIELEMQKVEPIIKNEKLEDRFNKWQKRLEEIKTEKLPRVEDMIIDLDVFIERKDFDTCRTRIAKTDLEIYKLRETSEHLLDEIREINLSEEKYRSIVTKLNNFYIILMHS